MRHILFFCEKKLIPHLNENSLRKPSFHRKFFQKSVSSLVLGGAFLLPGCAGQEDKEPSPETQNGEDRSSDATTANSPGQSSGDGVKSQAQPSSASSGQGYSPENASTRDSVTPSTSTSGPKGDKGDPGEKGPQGEPGVRGQSNGLVLFDQTGRDVGVGFMDSAQNAAYIFREDGSELYVDRQTGVLKAPAFDFMCLYETPDCSGACFVYDYRWINVVVTHQSQGTFRAPRESAGDLFVGAKSFQSYTSHHGSCEVNQIDATHAYSTEIYRGISVPLAAPLYWAKQK